MNVIVSSVISTPPPREIGRVSNSISLNLEPIIGSKLHPDPFAPVNVRDITLATSKSWGSTNTCFTLPLITGSTRAVPPTPVAIWICGGLITS